MEKLFIFLGATIAGYVGWWLGDFVGIMTAFIVSTIFTGYGMYVGRRAARHYLG
ncbi:MAG: hypothetical protein ABI877_08205 [Gemmatimonadaceae bacterium]